MALYDPREAKKQTIKRIENLAKKRTVCEKVVAVLEMQGWQEIIEPIIDRSIMDVVGGKIGDTWVSGKLDKARTDEKREYYIGYKQALIDLIGRIKFHKTEYKRIEDEIDLIRSEENLGFKMPMEDTRYATKER